MVPAWGCDDLLLNPGQKRLALCLRQTQIRKVGEITGAVDLQHLDAAGTTFSSGRHPA
jgi:hypothetical protein